MSKFLYLILLIFILMKIDYGLAMDAEQEILAMNEEEQRDLLMKADKKVLCDWIMKLRASNKESGSMLDRMRERLAANDESSSDSDYSENEDSEEENDGHNNQNDIEQNSSKTRLNSFVWKREDTCFFGGLFLACIYFVYRYFTYKDDVDEDKSSDKTSKLMLQYGHCT